VEILRWKTRITVLWVFLAVSMSAAMILTLLGPGVIEDLMAGEMEGTAITNGMLVLFSFFWLIPLIMAVLSLTLKDSANRWTNFALGVIFTVFGIGHLISHLVAGQLPPAQVLIYIAFFVVPGLITWYAWKWPKQEA
jgi:uncharacterized membrane protein